MTVQIFAHRGSSAAYAEHTRAAYLQAIADGADGVECDLHLTADGHLVLLHDETVDRTSTGSGRVAAMTLEQLRALDFSSWHGAAIPPEFGSREDQLLTLSELLEILHGAGRAVAVAIEFKYGAAFDPALIEAALASLHGRGWTPGTSMAGNLEVSFMSFHPAAVKYLAQRVPRTHLCQLLEDADPPEARAEPRPVAMTGAAAAEVLKGSTGEGERLVDDGVAHLAGPGVEYLRSHPADVARWVSAGRTLRVWTVNTAEALALCLQCGVTQVTSNVPGRIRSMLDEHQELPATLT